METRGTVRGEGRAVSRTKFDEFCLIDPRTKTKFLQGRDEVSRHCLLFDLATFVVPLHGTVQTELDSLCSGTLLFR